MTDVRCCRESVSHERKVECSEDRLELGPDPRHGLGGPYTRKKFFRTQVQIHTAATIRNKLRPPHTSTPPTSFFSLQSLREH